MRTGTYRKLIALRERHGPREFGKICQKLVALAFRAAACDHLVERAVQGVDIDTAWGTAKYAVEIKTTTTTTIQLATKDIAGLSKRGADGYRPLLGVLRLAPLSDWLVVDARLLVPGAVLVDSLRPYRCMSLEERLRPRFDEVLETHFGSTLCEAQRYLDRMLGEVGIMAGVGDSCGPDRT